MIAEGDGLNTSLENAQAEDSGNNVRETCACMLACFGIPSGIMLVVSLYMVDPSFTHSGINLPW